MGIRIGIGRTLLTKAGGSANTCRLVADGLIVYRKILRTGKYEIDYSDDGGDTWTLAIVSLYPDEDTIVIQIDDGVDGSRDLVRDGAYVIDSELTPTGFTGTEDIDWITVYYLKPE